MTNRPKTEKIQEDWPPPARVADSYVPRRRGKGRPHAELMTYVYRVAYDFITKTGDVFMEHTAVCTDKSGAISFFQRIDPKVKRIRTWQGAFLDVEYICRGEWWTDISYRKVAP